MRSTAPPRRSFPERLEERHMQEAWRFQVEFPDEDRMAEADQADGHVDQRQRAAHVTFVRVKCYVV